MKYPIKDHILAKVVKKETEAAYVSRCIKVNICPNCGEDLIWDADYDHGFCDYSCKNCDFTYCD